MGVVEFTGLRWWPWLSERPRRWPCHDDSRQGWGPPRFPRQPMAIRSIRGMGKKWWQDSAPLIPEGILPKTPTPFIGKKNDGNKKFSTFFWFREFDFLFSPGKLKNEKVACLPCLCFSMSHDGSMGWKSIFTSIGLRHGNFLGKAIILGCQRPLKPDSVGCWGFTSYKWMAWWWFQIFFIFIPKFREMIQIDKHIFVFLTWVGSTTNQWNNTYK